MIKLWQISAKIRNFWRKIKIYIRPRHYIRQYLNKEWLRYDKELGTYQRYDDDKDIQYDERLKDYVVGRILMIMCIRNEFKL